MERGLSDENTPKLILFQHIAANKVLFAVAAADVIVFKTAIRHRKLVLSLGCRNGLWQYSCDTHSESIKHSTAQHSTHTAEGRLTGNNKGKLGFVLRE